MTKTREHKEKITRALVKATDLHTVLCMFGEIGEMHRSVHADYEKAMSAVLEAHRRLVAIQMRLVAIEKVES